MRQEERGSHLLVRRSYSEFTEFLTSAARSVHTAGNKVTL